MKAAFFRLLPLLFLVNPGAPISGPSRSLASEETTLSTLKYVQGGISHVARAVEKQEAHQACINPWTGDEVPLDWCMPRTSGIRRFVPARTIEKRQIVTGAAECIKKQFALIDELFTGDSFPQIDVMKFFQDIRLNEAVVTLESTSQSGTPAVTLDGKLRVSIYATPLGNVYDCRLADDKALQEVVYAKMKSFYR
jgi:hypothetical protein